jgi:hypothetical protein
MAEEPKVEEVKILRIPYRSGSTPPMQIEVKEDPKKAQISFDGTNWLDIADVQNALKAFTDRYADALEL